MSSAFDLDQFAPAPIRFKLRGVEYRVPADVDTDVVARMLRIETAIGDADGLDATLDAVNEGRTLLLEMVQEEQPDVAELKIGAQAILVVFALILHGSSVAAAVAEAISSPTRQGEAAAETVTTLQDGPDAGGQEGEDGPLGSSTHSSERSSSSDEQDAGLLVTGSA